MAGTITFLDTETTSLDRERRRIWEVGLITRYPGGKTVERHWFIDTSLHGADPMSLKIGRYYDRHPDPHGLAEISPASSEESVARSLSFYLQDSLIVGAIPWFDMESIADLFREYDLVPNWNYHLVDIEALAAGRLGVQPPWNFDQLLEKFGLEYEERDRHTALGDARMVQALYEAVLEK